MVVEEIVNEIDKFITKYKALKSDNQTLTQFKSDVKTALNNKGIIILAVLMVVQVGLL